jgi:arginine decarboxylase-like protein
MITHDKRSAEVVMEESWTEQSNWNIEKAKRLYDFNAWGGGSFGVSENGEVVIHPEGTHGPAASICSILKELKSKNLRPPFLLRFPQLLANNIKEAPRFVRVFSD